MRFETSPLERHPAQQRRLSRAWITDQYYLTLADVDDASNEGHHLDTWVCYPDPLFEAGTVESESFSANLVLLGLTRGGSWCEIGKFPIGTIHADGVQRVIDGREFLGAVLRNAANYRDMALTLGTGQPTPNISPWGAAGNRSLLASILSNWEQVTEISRNTTQNPRDLNYYHYQSAGSPEEAAQWLDWMYHIKFQRKAHSFTGAQFWLGNITVQFRLPTGLIQTRVIGNNWTALD